MPHDVSGLATYQLLSGVPTAVMASCRACTPAAAAPAAPEVLTRAEWLAKRRELITASDVAAILGEDVFGRSQLSVYAEKVEGVELVPTVRMRRGIRLEPYIAGEYAEVTGRPVFGAGELALVVHPSIPWLAATLDRRTEGSELSPAPATLEMPGRIVQVPLELKAVLDLGHAREWEGEAAPIGYEIQLQVQCQCTATSWGSLAGFVPHVDELAVRDRLRDDAFFAAALPVLEEFHERLVQRRPPEADDSPASARAVRLLWGRGDGETVALDQDALDKADAWEAATGGRLSTERLERELDTKLRQRLGGATFGALPDGSYIELRKHGRGRVLRRRRPRLRRR